MWENRIYCLVCAKGSGRGGCGKKSKIHCYEAICHGKDDIKRMNDEKWTEEMVIEYFSMYEVIYKFNKKFCGWTVYAPSAPNKCLGPSRFGLFKDGLLAIICDDCFDEKEYKKLDKIYDKDKDYELIDLRDRQFGINKIMEEVLK